jgi:hypothetical protein
MSIFDGDLFDGDKELLITNLLSFNSNLFFPNDNSIFPNDKKRPWARSVCSKMEDSFPDAFVSCDSIYSNKRSTVTNRNYDVTNRNYDVTNRNYDVGNKNKNNTLFIENPSSDEIVRREFFKYPGYLGIKSSEYFGKKLCFVTFNSIEHAEYALTNCSIKSTFARNSTRNYN